MIDKTILRKAHTQTADKSTRKLLERIIDADYKPTVEEMYKIQTECGLSDEEAAKAFWSKEAKLQPKGKYNLDCVNDRECGSVWGTHTTLENINEAVQQRGRFNARIEFCGILEEYNGNRFAFFKDYYTAEEDNYFVELEA